MGEEITIQSVPMMKADAVIMAAEPVVQSQPDLALWFLFGSVVAIIGYVLYGIVSNYKRK